MKFNQRNVGNALDMLSWKRLVPDIADIAFFDPQYRGVLNHLGFGNEGERMGGRAALPQMDPVDIATIGRELVRVIKPSGYVFLWLDKFELMNFNLAHWNPGGLDNPPQIVDLITWDKGRIGMGKRTRRRAEYLLVIQKQPVLASATWRDHGIPDVWFEKAERRTKTNGVHPHRKPQALMKRLVLATTQPGDLVLNPCAGSYGVLDICRATGREYFGCDLIKQEKRRRA